MEEMKESIRLRCYRDLACPQTQANTKSKPATYARQGYRRMGCIASYKVEQPRSESEASMGTFDDYILVLTGSRLPEGKGREERELNIEV